MKNCLSLIVLLVLLCALPLHAQMPVVELPELEEWYSVSGVNAVSYLPGFSSNGGMNAIAVHTKDDPTWFNRFAYDTVNQFLWEDGGSWVIVQGDFNGDGIMDYMDRKFKIYKGIEKNKPPTMKSVAQIIVPESVSSNWIVSDFNKDGYDDIILPCRTGILSEAPLLVVLLGNKDLSKMQIITVNDKAVKNTVLIGTFMNQEGKARIVTYKHDDTRWEGFLLQSLDFTMGDIQATCTPLDSFGGYLLPDELPKYNFFIPNDCLYTSKKNNEYSLIILESHNAVGSTRGYRIENDKMIFVDSYIPSPDWFSGLSTSVDGDDKEDYLGGGGIMKGTQVIDGYFIISGNPVGQLFKPRGFIPRFNCGGDNVVKAIGDVSGDGVGDLVEYARDGCFTIFKGINWQAVSVNENNNNFKVHTTEPNPIGVERIAVFPITITQNGHYILALYDVSGKLIAELFSGELPVGEQRIPISIKAYNLSPGFYTLRLSDGKNIRERGILITNQP